MNMYLFFKMPTSTVITACSLLILLLLFQLINMDTDGIKQNVTQTSLQPPGLLNLNVFVHPKITQGSFTESNLSSQVHSHIYVSIRICVYQWIRVAAVKIFLSFTAAVATRIHPASIIQQCRQLPLDMI